MSTASALLQMFASLLLQLVATLAVMLSPKYSNAALALGLLWVLTVGFVIYVNVHAHLALGGGILWVSTMICIIFTAFCFLEVVQDVFILE